MKHCNIPKDSDQRVRELIKIIQVFTEVHHFHFSLNMHLITLLGGKYEKTSKDMEMGML